jgi:hypothetical protein
LVTLLCAAIGYFHCLADRDSKRGADEIAAEACLAATRPAIHPYAPRPDSLVELLKISLHLIGVDSRVLRNGIEFVAGSQGGHGSVCRSAIGDPPASRGSRMMVRQLKPGLDQLSGPSRFALTFRLAG